MRRRTFLASAFLSVSCPKLVFAQPSARVFRLGWIVTLSAASSAPLLDALRAGLADLDYVEGRNLVIEVRYADDVLSRVQCLYRFQRPSGVVAQGLLAFQVVLRGVVGLHSEARPRPTRT